MRPAHHVDGSVIEDANSWREVVVTEIMPGDDDLPRSRVRARVVASGTGTQPAARAVPRPARRRRSVDPGVAAAVAGRRARSAELERLQELVDKTAGPRERAAMDYVRRYVAERT